MSLFLAFAAVHPGPFRWRSSSPKTGNDLRKKYSTNVRFAIPLSAPPMLKTNKYAAVSPKLKVVPVWLMLKVGLVALEVYMRARRASAACCSVMVSEGKKLRVWSKIVWSKSWLSPK